MDDNLQKITNALNLRPPQAESLKLFAQLTKTLTLKKNPDLQAELSKVQKFFIYKRLPQVLQDKYDYCIDSYNLPEAYSNG